MKEVGERVPSVYISSLLLGSVLDFGLAGEISQEIAFKFKWMGDRRDTTDLMDTHYYSVANEWLAGGVGKGFRPEPCETERCPVADLNYLNEKFICHS